MATRRAQTRSNQKLPELAGPIKIHPIVMFPFTGLRTTENLALLYSELGKLKSPEYVKPITVVNMQSFHRNKRPATGDQQKDKTTADMYERCYAIAHKHSTIVPIWTVDTCGMWIAGFGEALKSATVNDVFWLIPGDFYYALPGGKDALHKMMKIPRRVYDGDCQLCLGEIDVPPNSPKQLIDTYGTYGLLYNWFPAEAQGIRLITDKPRTEFFAIHHDFLKTALIKERWYGYEQTIVILLQNMRGMKTVRTVLREKLGAIEDDPGARSTLASAMQQVERTERVIKQFWREINEQKYPGTWSEKFRTLDAQSEQIRGAAMTVLQQLLT